VGSKELIPEEFKQAFLAGHMRMRKLASPRITPVLI